MFWFYKQFGQQQVGLDQVLWYVYGISRELLCLGTMYFIEKLKAIFLADIM